MAILTSELAPERRTTASFCAATSVTRREPHPAVGDGQY
ncbi:hypothetical protein BCGT_1871 [Mycobacterium tuberculosis variant bovis BCG str. ATCC 35743]|nr:hypothetical protein BCGT_1871 [Mycobacterium tuberculosis variant bovis BCG str. ATCC 35743]KDA15724.1 hypothetical protein CO60_1158 [Mycobacterium tuberculosis]KRT42454.1 hypothetical protein HX90_0797 [Mycobacterium tuberculosis]